MIFISLILVLLVLPFAYVVIFGAPYVPAHTKAINIAVAQLKLSKAGRVIDLGCGDGKFLIASAKKGYKCTGYEANPLLFLLAKLRLARYKNAEVKLSNFWKADFPNDTEVVYIFLLDRFMVKLDKKMQKEANRLGKNLKLISYVFEIPGRKATLEDGGIKIYAYSPK